MARLRDDGNLDFDQADWEAPAPKKNQNPYFDPNQNIAPGSDIPLANPPGGQVGQGSFNDQDPFTPTPTPNPMPHGSEDDWRKTVAGWAAEEGADPTLTNNPQYAIDRFNQTGGLNAGNMDYWHNAYVGPNAFYKNPGREGSGGGGSASSAGSGSNLSSFLYNMLMNGGGNKSDPARGALLQRLNGLMDQYSQPVTKDDPSIAASTQAYTGQVGRSVNRFKKQAAERALAEGVPTGAFDSQIGGAEMSGGRAIGDHETQLMRDEMLSRRNALMSTAGSVGSLLSAQDSADIQSKIAAMDAALKARGLDLNDKGLDINDRLGTQGLDIQKMLGQGGLNNQSRSIDNQNGQFYDKLGSDNANQGSQLDQILQSLLLGR